MSTCKMRNKFWTGQIMIFAGLESVSRCGAFVDLTDNELDDVMDKICTVDIIYLNE